jgi:hypothetical protein
MTTPITPDHSDDTVIHVRVRQANLPCLTTGIRTGYLRLDLLADGESYGLYVAVRDLAESASRRTQEAA